MKIFHDHGLGLVRSRWLCCTVVVAGLATTKALADEHDRSRRDQRGGGQGQQPSQGQPQHPQGQQPQHPQPQGQPQQHPQPQGQPQHPQPQGQPQRHEQHPQPPQGQPQQHGWGAGPADRHDEHFRHPEPAPVPYGRPQAEPAYPGRPMPPPRYEPGRPLPPPPGRVERGRPLPPPPAPRYAPARPLPPPMHAGRPLRPAAPVYVEVAPPRLRYEARPARPSPASVWIDGYWGWEGGAHVWIAGEWAVPPEPGYAWEPAHWRRHGHRWAYSPGYWRHRTGPLYVAPEAPAPVYEGGVTISGRVMSMQGAPVPGVMVVLAGTQEGRIVTDASGTYVFGGLPPGSYAVRPTGDCAFAPDVANFNNLYTNVTQDIIVSGCGGW